MGKEIYEYRGVEGLVAAEVIKDDADAYEAGEVFDIAGVAEIGRATENSSETHYYDNMAAVVIDSVGADTITCSVSAIPLDVFAKLTGQIYDAEKGVLIEGPRETKYFALGYRTKNTKGEEVFVWRLKGKFNIPDQTNSTENDGTDANGQELVYTGIQTTHKFTNVKDKNGNIKGAKAINVNVALGLADVSTFFDEVTTPDTLQAAPTYALTIVQDEGTTVTVKRNGTTLSTGANLRAGDVLTISCEDGTLEVNDEAFVSGNTYTVSGNVEVVSTAS